MKFIDNFLNNITMYRLVLYYLCGLLLLAIIYSFFGVLSFNPFALLGTILFLVFVSWVANYVFAYAYEAPTNIESVYITALILALIVTPYREFHQIPYLGWVAVMAVASKFILAIKRKHIFNPAAFSVLLLSLTLGNSASWWVGTGVMIPAVLAGGLLIARKIRRFDLVFSFLTVTVVTTFAFSILRGSNLTSIFRGEFLDSPLLFFAFVMLTEPLTTPPTEKLRSIYGSLVGLLFAPQFHIASFSATPEIALVIGNIFSYIVSPKDKLILKLKEKIQLGPDIFDFIFEGKGNFKFTPGQYLEWTFSHKNSDSRGNRRFFTIASSPSEDMRIGVKVNNPSSSFKYNLVNMTQGGTIVAGSLAGEFTLPKDVNKKLVFVAGGIGVTPFRSIISDLLSRNEKRDIVLLYSNKVATDIVYKDVFDNAQNRLGIKTVYSLTDMEHLPNEWWGRAGRIDDKVITDEIPDYKERIFYLSGPHAMVQGYEDTLSKMGIKRSQMKVDYFPGFA